MDWGHCGTVAVGNTRRALSVFVMVLSHSRQMYIEFTLSQKQEHFLACHAHAFEYFGGVPESVMIDNLKTGVLEHKRGETPRWNPRYEDFARDYGFAIVTGEKPHTLWEKERPHLQELPVNAPSTAMRLRLRASSTFRLCIETNRYSVPAQQATTWTST